MGNAFEIMGFPGGSDGKELACSAGDLGLIPGLGRCPGEGNGYPLQFNSLKMKACFPPFLVNERFKEFCSALQF